MLLCTHWKACFRSLAYDGTYKFTLTINAPDFSAHSNYVELSLLLLGKQRPENDLNDVFTYVGDAANVQTRAGPAPPIVTGSFGPLDMLDLFILKRTDER